MKSLEQNKWAYSCCRVICWFGSSPAWAGFTGVNPLNGKENRFLEDPFYVLIVLFDSEYMREQKKQIKHQTSLQAGGLFGRSSPLAFAITQVYQELYKAQQIGDIKVIRGASGKLGRIKAKAKAQCKVMVVKFLIRDLDLDMTIHLASQLMMIWFEGAVATATLVEEFGTKGRRADRKSEDFGRLSEPWVETLKPEAKALLEDAVFSAERAYSDLIEQTRAEFSKLPRKP